MKKCIVVSGSFRRHFVQIKETILQLEKMGIVVLSPQPSSIVSSYEQFPILESDETTDPRVLEQRHLVAIRLCDAVYVVNPNGYIGLSTAMEIGWALANGKKVYMQHLPEDVTMRSFTTDIISPNEIALLL